MKPDFDFAQNTATKLLLSQNISELFIDIRNFQLRSDIIIDTMQHYSVTTGVPLPELQECAIQGAITLSKYGKHLILYDDLVENERRKHWGIAHEVGHVYLDHANDSAKEEIEAHFFAAQVIAPEIVLIELSKRKCGINCLDLYNHFNLSLEAAQKRLQTLRNRGCWNSGDIDKALLSKYKPLICGATSHRYRAS
jgi:hypothetical protein